MSHQVFVSGNQSFKLVDPGSHSSTVPILIGALLGQLHPYPCSTGKTYTPAVEMVGDIDR